MTDTGTGPAQLPPREVEVLVVGGGIAGVAAAIAARRAGARRVLLLERQFLLGGLATTGLISIYLPLCDGRGTQVTFGLAEELLRLGAEKGAEGLYPDAWLNPESDPEERNSQRYQVQLNPWHYALKLEELCLATGVDLLYGAVVAEVSCQNERIHSVLVQFATAERLQIQPCMVVDASGDAIVATLAGEETALYKQRNILAAWYRHFDGTTDHLQPLGAAELPNDEREERGLPPAATAERWTGVGAVEQSDFALKMHRWILKDARGSLTALPQMPQLRMTRRIVGVTIPDEDPEAVYSDSIGVIANWRRPGPGYEIPFGSLHGRRVRNLLVAGRCSAATERFWDQTRVIPACALTGEAAGTAAALCDAVPDLSIERLQEQLRRAGVQLRRPRSLR
ncbi:MAG: FAD-dependent oxidoreductase [Bacillota bacterium]|nr:FAD-dependent oxidoreductase [Bacillota bacterium]